MTIQEWNEKMEALRSEGNDSMRTALETAENLKAVAETLEKNVRNVVNGKTKNLGLSVCSVMHADLDVHILRDCFHLEDVIEGGDEEEDDDPCDGCDEPVCDGCEYDEDCDDCGYGVDRDDCPYYDGDDCESCPYDDDVYAPTKKGRKIIEAMKQAKEEPPQESSKYAKGTRVGIIPRPCVKDTGCTTVKDYLQKINEELDELKEAAMWWTCSADFKVEDTVEEIKNDVQGSRDTLDDYMCGSRWHIAEEAADVCTAVTSLCEALTIDEHMRNAAQQKVNAHNKERGRW